MSVGTRFASEDTRYAPEWYEMDEDYHYDTWYEEVENLDDPTFGYYDTEPDTLV